jgi:hypothetical protein
MPDHVDRIVQAWRRERPDLDLAALVLLGRLFRTAHLADAALAKPLAAHGLQPGRFDLLAALRRAGEPYAQASDVLYADCCSGVMLPDATHRRGDLCGSHPQANLASGAPDRPGPAVNLEGGRCARALCLQL